MGVPMPANEGEMWDVFHEYQVSSLNHFFIVYCPLVQCWPYDSNCRTTLVSHTPLQDKLVERSRPSSSRAGPGRSRGRRRQTLDSSQLAESQERENEAQGGLVLSNSVSSDNLSEVPEATLQRRAGSATSSSEVLSSPRVGSTQSISDSYQTDTEKVRSPERVKSPATLRSPSRARSPERHQGAPSAVPEEEDKEDEDGPSEAAAEGGALASQEEASEVTSTTTDGTDTEGHVVRYNGQIKAT